MPNDDSEVNLQRLFKELAASAPEPGPGLIESRLRLACRSRRISRSRRRLGIGGLVLAACGLLALAWGWRIPRQQRIPAGGSSYAGFMALPYSQTDVPMEQAVIIQVDVQPVDLERLGLPAALVVGRKHMRADLLIGQDGVARAVRLTE